MKYLDKVKNPKLRRALQRAYSTYGYKAYFLPSTITGKYHPPDERGFGGLLRHMDRVAWLVDKIADEYRYSETVRDALITSAYFHDLGKVKQTTVSIEFITNRKGKKNWFTRVVRNIESLDNHPLISRTIAREFLEKEQVLEDVIDLISDLISTHMSFWYPHLPQPQTELEKLFALADFIVSQQEFRIEEEKSLWQKIKRKLKH